MSNHLVWFRNDLRLDDHEPLVSACQVAAQQNGSVIAVYVVDPRFFGETAFGFPRTGPFRKRFLKECLADLEKQLESKGAQLLLVRGEPETVLPAICRSAGVTQVSFYHEVAPEEQAIEARVVGRLEELSVACKVSLPASLYSRDDLPYPVQEIPEVFTKFRRVVEKKATPAMPLDAPTTIPGASDLVCEGFDRLDLGDVEELSQSELTLDSRQSLSLVGGEIAGNERLDHYLWHSDAISTYKRTRNGMLAADDSSKFSAWLAMGCLSARRIFAEVSRYENERTKNDSTYWMIFELLWRDYFALMVEKHGAKAFQVGGLRQRPLPWRQDWAAFDAWREGRTGYPLIDANMKELAASGLMSNRGRQNVASFLTKNLGVDWRMGAEWFESMLVDYDACSNYGNWNYSAGVGNDAREFRWFNTLKQSKDYDPEGAYVRHWIPALKNLPSEWVHRPWEMDASQQQAFSCVIGSDYPAPIVDLFKSADENQQRFAENAT